MPDNRHFVGGARSRLQLVDADNGAIRKITAGTSDEHYPAVSPDGSKIAYESVAYDSDLVEIALSSPDVRSLLATSRRESSPSWSPSGNQFAYASDALGVSEIWLRSPAEGTARRIVSVSVPRGAEGIPDRGLLGPKLSPDGQKVVYSSVETLWVSPVAGGQAVPITEPGSFSVMDAAWSPDGNWIAFARRIGAKQQLVKTPSGGGGTSVVLLEAGQSSRLLGVSGTSSGFLGSLDWSPTGDWIAYSSGDGLHLIAPDGNNDHLLTSSQPAVFGFTRDGASIHGIRRNEGRRWERVTFRVRDGRESDTAELSLPPAATLAGFGLHPDGKRFATTVSTYKSEIWILEGSGCLPAG
jgi:Tol biopolymer transport system component